MYKYLLILFALQVPITFGYESDYTYIEDLAKSSTTNGGIGLIEIPTARFSYDGELTFGISSELPYNRLFATSQVFPWLETVVKYTEETWFPYSPGNPQTDKDKGFDIKLRLSQEGKYRPAIALGISDIGGTAAYGSEYIVASKQYNNIDFTIGLGWGRLNGKDHIRNPLDTLVSRNFRNRAKGDGLGGTIGLGQFFSGREASFFGGVEYYSPIDNLSLKLEYDSSDYSRVIGQEKVFYKTGDIIEIDSPFNLALNYRMNMSNRDKLDLSIGIVRGNTFYANFSAHTNLNIEPIAKYTSPSEILNQPYLEPFGSLDEGWQKYLTELIVWQMGNEGLVTHNIIFNNNEMQVEISQSRFKKPMQAIDLASRILANNSPKNIDTITVINIDQGIETLRTTIPRDTLVNSVSKGPLEESYVVFNTIPVDKSDYIVRENEYMYPNFFWSVKPHMNGTIQHQIKFFFWQLEALVHAEYAFMKGLYLSADVGIDITNNFDEYTSHTADGDLHHVRQDRRLYLTEGETGLRRMALDYLFDINPNFSGRISAGYLEWMYGGIGGELLYMPDSKDWALGFDAYWLKQRDFDQKFSFREYETITGFINFYYDLPFYDMSFKGSYGKFLGKDKGYQLEMSRRFKTGATVGGRVALTDCDYFCVGEGSFNKWIYFTMPMDAFYINSTTRGKAGYAWSPLTKDAGTRVDAGSLYNLKKDAPDQVESLRRKSWSIKKIISGFHTGAKY